MVDRYVWLMSTLVPSEMDMFALGASLSFITLRTAEVNLFSALFKSLCLCIGFDIAFSIFLEYVSFMVLEFSSKGKFCFAKGM